MTRKICRAATKPQETHPINLPASVERFHELIDSVTFVRTGVTLTRGDDNQATSEPPLSSTKVHPVTRRIAATLKPAPAGVNCHGIAPMALGDRAVKETTMDESQANLFDQDELFSTRQARALLGVNTAMVHKCCKAGILPSPVKINGRDHWRATAVRALMASDFVNHAEEIAAIPGPDCEGRVESVPGSIADDYFLPNPGCSFKVYTRSAVESIFTPMNLYELTAAGHVPLPLIRIGGVDYWPVELIKEVLVEAQLPVP